MIVFTKEIFKDFYNNFVYGYYDVKGKISGGKTKEYYEQLTYKRVATDVKITDDQSLFKTIHKSKGDEFKNVLVVIPEDDKKTGNKCLEFLLSPDMSKEEHRVYYVALSRAKEKLYINVPTITVAALNKLKHLNMKYIQLSLEKETVSIK